MKSYILIDRSGSMSTNWVETIGAVNAYAEELGANKSPERTDITVAVFDSHNPFEVVRTDVNASKWNKISPTEVTPRGGTPLYDAIGQLNALIKKDDPKKAAIVIVTDGAENMSREFNKNTAKILLDGLRETGYDVVFIGADFDAFGQSSGLGGMHTHTLNMAKGNYETAFRSMATRTAVYGEQGSEAVMNFFSDDVRASALGKN